MKKTSGKTNPPGFGWMRNLPDKRDHLYPLPLAKLRAFPSQVDLRRHCQCHRSSDRVRSEEEKLAYFTRSRFFIHYNERKIDHGVPLHDGAPIQIRCLPRNRVALRRDIALHHFPLLPAYAASDGSVRIE